MSLYYPVKDLPQHLRLAGHFRSVEVRCLLSIPPGGAVPHRGGLPGLTGGVTRVAKALWRTNPGSADRGYKVIVVDRMNSPPAALGSYFQLHDRAVRTDSVYQRRGSPGHPEGASQSDLGDNGGAVLVGHGEDGVRVRV